MHFNVSELPESNQYIAAQILKCPIKFDFGWIFCPAIFERYFKLLNLLKCIRIIYT